jgi:CheY-like chemotaxis protein
MADQVLLQRAGREAVGTASRAHAGWRRALAGAGKAADNPDYRWGQMNRRLLRATLRTSRTTFSRRAARRTRSRFSIRRSRPVILDLMVPGMSGPEFCGR